MRIDTRIEDAIVGVGMPAKVRVSYMDLDPRHVAHDITEFRVENFTREARPELSLIVLEYFTTGNDGTEAISHQLSFAGGRLFRKMEEYAGRKEN